MRWLECFTYGLTYCGPLTSYGVGDLGLHSVMWWLIAWRHQGVTWTIIDLYIYQRDFWHSFLGNIYLNIQAINTQIVFKTYTFEITATYARWNELFGHSHRQYKNQSSELFICRQWNSCTLISDVEFARFMEAVDIKLTKLVNVNDRVIWRIENNLALVQVMSWHRIGQKGITWTNANKVLRVI